MDSETLVAGVTAGGEGSAVNSASAGVFSLSAVIGLFNIIVGLMLVAAFLMFFGGLAGYLTRLGLVGREQGLHYMNWGVTILFVLIILIGIVQFFQFHPEVMFAILAFVVIAAVIWVVVKSLQEGGEEAEH